jgi:hypothetical protein
VIDGGINLQLDCSSAGAIKLNLIEKLIRLIEKLG